MRHSGRRPRQLGAPILNPRLKDGPVGMDAALQCELFSFALNGLGEAGQGSGLVNGVLEVFLDALDGELELYRYELPKGSRA